MRITVTELLEAAKKNGYEWGGHEGNTRIQIDPISGEETQIGFCILEQAAKNLGLVDHAWNAISEQINMLMGSKTYGVGRDIWVYNDDEATSYEDAYNYMERRLEFFKDKEIELADTWKMDHYPEHDYDNN